MNRRSITFFHTDLPQGYQVGPIIVSNILLLLASSSRLTSRPTFLQNRLILLIDLSSRCVCVCVTVCVRAHVMFLIFACFAFVLFIVLLVQRYEDALASRCALKVLFIINIRYYTSVSLCFFLCPVDARVLVSTTKSSYYMTQHPGWYCILLTCSFFDMYVFMNVHYVADQQMPHPNHVCKAGHCRDPKLISLFRQSTTNSNSKWAFTD